MTDNKKLIEDIQKMLVDLKADGKILLDEYIKKMREIEDILAKETAIKI